MNPCNGMISPPAPKTPGNHGRYRHIHLGAYVLAHHVSFPNMALQQTLAVARNRYGCRERGCIELGMSTVARSSVIR